MAGPTSCQQSPSITATPAAHAGGSLACASSLAASSRLDSSKVVPGRIVKPTAQPPGPSREVEDLPGADHQTLLDSIARLLALLPDDTGVLPGHMDPTTLGLERRTNPFIRARAYGG